MATINGDGSDNTLNGTSGDDDITGGGGSDTINAGGGNDTVYGDDGDNLPLGTLIYQDTFDSDAAGWIPANHEDDGGYFDGILGRFVGTSNATDIEVSRDFDLDTSYDHAVVEFDFHRIDSWDYEEFQIYSGTDEIFSQNFWSSNATGGSNTVTIGGTTYTVTLTSLGNASPKGFTSGQWWNDQTFRVRIEIENAPDTLELGFGTTLNQGLADESYGFDNFAIVSTDDLSMDVVAFINTNDTISGGAGDDTIFGEEGDDILSGDAGSDTIYGGIGADTIDGGDDADILYGGSGDTIDGGEGGDDNDTLIIDDVGATIAYDANPEDGVVTFSDGTTLTFTNIENVVLPCFTPGTLIKTANGQVRIENLKTGDLVETYDNGQQRIKWIGKRKLTTAELSANPHLQPILIREGSLGVGRPEKDMVVSPQHRMLIRNSNTEYWFGEQEVLVKAKDLTNAPGVDRIKVSDVTYIHLLFEQHEIILADNAWAESFQPGDMLEDAASGEVFSELLGLFPELAHATGRSHYNSARMTLKKHETHLVY